MRILLRLLLVLLFFYACSNDKGDIPTEPKETKEFELSNKIIGKWDADYNLGNSQASNSKQFEPACYIFSLVFKPDNSFQINYRNGTLEGNYEVINEEEIRLNSEGNISQIRFVNGGLSFYISLEGICSLQLNCFRDPDYAQGECSSFLKCNNQKIWKRVENGTNIYVKFFDYFEGTWYRKFKIENNQNCYSVESNQLEEGTMVLVTNNVNKLVFVYETGDNNDIYTYSIASNGDLNLKIENNSGTITKVYFLSNQQDFDNNLDIPECGAKTYVPDDGFEQYLIDSGYDHVLDDYVLTENIYYVESLQMDDYYYDKFQNLIGLQDFRSIKHLSVFAKELESIDLTSNTDLEFFYFIIPNLMSLDLTLNKKLKSFLIEQSQFENLDLSQNSMLEGFEFNTGKLKILDISDNLNLKGFQVDSCPLESIITVENPTLESIIIGGYIYNMPLVEIDISVFPNLRYINIESSNLNKIDLSKNLELEECHLWNNDLQKLDISSNFKIKYLKVEENPDLKCVQVAQIHLDRINANSSIYNWTKDEQTEFSLDCGY